MKIMPVIRLTMVFGFFVSVALCQFPPTLALQGISGTSATLSASDIANLPNQTIRTTDHGTPVTFDGVLLNDVLASVRTPTGETFNKSGSIAESMGRAGGSSGEFVSESVGVNSSASDGASPPLKTKTKSF